ncbi:disease resistance protein RUN1-like [Macadamia integrifolia]|uniref:disease resistance protein RUN1-like n=1 Tax=Macadamia integrifolia TaxID=60698 RepID=UPI001C5294A8|nr:disease resistance protein RUN1-like [Macadamia integrifolia]
MASPYDVFISFRGSDTPTNYSKYCLMELAEIWECHLSNGQTILPVFIDVEPLDVRHQTGSFKGPFQEHQRKYESPDVNSWKNALKEVGNLKGWHLKGDTTIEDQLNLVKQIVHSALRELNSIPFDECKYRVGIDSHIVKLLSLLNSGSNGVCFVTICGMDGLGKTTIAKAIYNCILRSFDGSSFLTNVREEASQGDKGLLSLQKRLLNDILKRYHEVSIVSQLVKMLLHGKKVFILDDVDDHVQLDVLVGGINWFGQGSRVIITTTDDQKNEPPEKFKELSHKIVQYAKGLPLTLEVLGSFLFGKEKEDCEDISEGLKDILDNMVSGMSIKRYDEKTFAKLMISYNKLSDHAKIIFPDTTCHFIGCEADKAITIWEACELRPRLAIKELILKHLLKIDDGKLMMHDQLQFMGMTIVSKDTNGGPAKHTRLWSHFAKSIGNLKQLVELSVSGTKINELPDGIDYKRLQPLLISMSSFAQLQELYLQSYMNLESLPKLPSTLTRLEVKKCISLQIISDLSHVEMLKELLVYDCESLVKVPDLSKLKRLVELNVEGCPKLTELLNLSNLKKLRKLEIFNCENLEKIHGLEGTESLEVLILSCCHELTELPDLSNLKKLSELEIDSCENIKEIHGIQGMESLIVLLLIDFPQLRELPDMSNLKRLTRIDIGDCKSRENSPLSRSRVFERVDSERLLQINRDEEDTWADFFRWSDAYNDNDEDEDDEEDDERDRNYNETCLDG